MKNDLSRRCLLAGTAGGFFAWALRHGGGSLFAQSSPARAKRCVVLWMNGGPSQIDTFDPKPGEETGGEFRPIETAAPGARIGEHLPRIARRMDRLSIVRSIQSKEGDHLRGQYLFHTGYPLLEGFARPAAGSVVSRETPDLPFPKYVTLGAPGFGPAYLGAAHAPFAIDDLRKALETFRSLGTRRDRIRLLRDLDREFDEAHPSEAVERRGESVRKIESLVDTPFVRALDLGREPARERERYGEHDFGRRCLAARRLLEAGASFVEVHLDGWDTHVDNFAKVKELCGILDGPWAALVEDLEARGLLAETVVLWMGEFGRTPHVNERRGRDHYPRVTCAVVGGGGLQGGRVIGETDRLGTAVVKDPVTVPDLFATLFAAFGVDPARRSRTEFGGTATLTDGGRPLKALF